MLWTLAGSPGVRRENLTGGEKLYLTSPNTWPEVRNLDHSMPFLWAVRPVDETPDYNEVVTWPDDEEEAGGNSSKLFAVSENTGNLLKDAFLKGLANSSRRQL